MDALDRGVTAIIQARLGSTRLPGKVLLPLGDDPMLSHVVRRVQASATVDHVVVATTTEGQDDALARFCREQGWPCVRGDEHDVLDRYYTAARDVGAEVVVRITSDCPLLDPAVVDRVVQALADDPANDYASNTLEPRTFPRGLDVEAFTMDALGATWHEDSNPDSREHVTPLMRRANRFRRVRVAAEDDHSQLRWTVDTAEDLRVVDWIIGAVPEGVFSWHEALRAIEENPGVMEWNREIRQKKIPEGRD